MTIFVLLVFLVVVLGCSCSNSMYSVSSRQDFSRERFVKSEPKNLFAVGTGHSAGYKWAQDNEVDSCGGSSSIFIEGCEEYLAQRELAK